MHKNLIITCDVESLVFGQEFEESKKNIFGVISPGEILSGIDLMMKLVDDVGGKIVFFYDVFTEYSYPGINKLVAERINDRGHILELHAHIEHLNNDWWKIRGYKKPTWATNYFDYNTVELVYSDALELFNYMNNANPKAFRAGSWRYNSSILDFMCNNGVEFSFNYHPLCALRTSYPHGPDAGPLNPFKWSNGLIEVPVSNILGPNKFSQVQKYFGFENHNLKSHDDYVSFLKTLNMQELPDRFIVLVMHSWSLSSRNNLGIVNMADSRLIDSFREFLYSLDNLNIKITNTDLYNLLRQYNFMHIVPTNFAGWGNSKLINLS